MTRVHGERKIKETMVLRGKHSEERRSFRLVGIAVRTTVLLLFLIAVNSAIYGQQVVDKTVATVSDSSRTELITYSDILWQLALQPESQVENPSSAELEQTLQTLIDQRIFALEAERLPRAAPTEAEIAEKITETLSYFPSPAAFEARLNRVGFESIKDDNFERLIAQRLSIEKYIDFRFGSFVVITPEDESKYYRDVFVPDFRRRSPGVLVPTLEERRAQINNTLTREKTAQSIERFLDEAKRRVRIEILIKV